MMLLYIYYLLLYIYWDILLNNTRIVRKWGMTFINVFKVQRKYELDFLDDTALFTTLIY